MQTINEKVGPPIISSLSLEGVNGYKTLTATFERNVKIITAENGAGKTTLLNALYALLSGKLERLSILDFKVAILRFANGDELAYPKDALLKLTNIEFAMRGRSPASGLRIRDQAYSQIADTHIRHEKLFNRIFPGITCLYLPTYRRIEENLSNLDKRKELRDALNGKNIQEPEGSLIFFGMDDINFKLQQARQRIKDKTLSCYNEVSAQTLSTLLANDHLQSNDIGEIERRQLSLVFTRLDKVGSAEEKKLNALIDNGEINKREHQALRAFLTQLLEIQASTRDLENTLQTFVTTVDSYWQQTSDEKRFQFDPETAEAYALDVRSGKRINLDQLSSGEKQIISIFATLYLEPEKRYIVLIDEPELSLSIEWQRKFLPDIFRSPSCAQLIAITHSPFIFDNELDPYAGSLSVTYDQVAK